jgi:hypothetical protein
MPRKRARSKPGKGSAAAAAADEGGDDDMSDVGSPTVKPAAAPEPSPAKKPKDNGSASASASGSASAAAAGSASSAGGSGDVKMGDGSAGAGGVKGTVLLLGCGLVAPPLIHYLDGHRIAVVVASRSRDKTLKVIAGLKHATAVEWDLDRPHATEELEALTQKADIVCSLLPYTAHTAAAKVALKYKKVRSRQRTVGFPVCAHSQ